MLIIIKYLIEENIRKFNLKIIYFSLFLFLEDSFFISILQRFSMIQSLCFICICWLMVTTQNSRIKLFFFNKLMANYLKQILSKIPRNPIFFSGVTTNGSIMTAGRLIIITGSLKILGLAISNLITFLYNLQRTSQAHWTIMKFSQPVKKQQSKEPQQCLAEEKSQSRLNETILNKFISYMTQLRNNQLREGVKNIYGRHYAVNFNPKYDFKEQWQSKARHGEQNNPCEIIQSELPIAYIYSIVLLFFQVFLVWYFSTYRLIGLIKEPLTLTILLVSILVALVDAAIRFHLRFGKPSVIVQWWEVFQFFRDSIALMLYYLLNLTLVELEIDQSSNPLMYLLDVVAVRLLYVRSKRLFRHFKIRSYTTAYKHYFKILDLASNILSIQHIFALLIYAVSFSDPNSNWLMHYGHPDATNFQRYYYSFYFTSTTIFTIGYGDIVPINNMEIFCVLIMQMLGIANFSYLINEIGYTLSAIRKEEEELEHNISTLSKMCKFYKIEPDLANIAKEYLLNNQQSFQDIQPQQENQVLMKLNENLREALTFENSLNIVKSSLFFICHWTKLFQTEIAKRLVKKILIPNEMIIQAAGKENIYVIKSGKLEVYTNNCIGFRKSFKKLLKTIEPKVKNEISDNIYGYSSIISARQVKLNAISKDFTCVYFIDKHAFMECVHESKLDTQYYFEIRANLEQTKYVEAYQAPAILNIRQHYRPSETFIIKKNVQRLKKYRNTRCPFDRHTRSKVASTNIIINNKDDIERCASTSREIRLTLYDVSAANANRCSLVEATNQVGKEDSHSVNKELILTSYFEMMKDYQKYFKRFNITNILHKLEKENLAYYRDIDSETHTERLFKRCHSAVTLLHTPKS